MYSRVSHLEIAPFILDKDLKSDAFWIAKGAVGPEYRRDEAVIWRDVVDGFPSDHRLDLRNFVGPQRSVWPGALAGLKILKFLTRGSVDPGKGYVNTQPAHPDRCCVNSYRQSRAAAAKKRPRLRLKRSNGQDAKKNNPGFHQRGVSLPSIKVNPKIAEAMIILTIEISFRVGNRIDRPIGFFMRVSGSSRAQHPRSFSQSSVRNSI